MKVVSQDVPVIKFVPRFYPDQSETLIVTFESGIIVPFTWIPEKNLISITFSDTSLFVQGTSYSFTVTHNSNTVYKGKVIFVKNGTDIQNYTAKSQNTTRWQ